MFHPPLCGNHYDDIAPYIRFICEEKYENEAFITFLGINSILLIFIAQLHGQQKEWL